MTSRLVQIWDQVLDCDTALQPLLLQLASFVVSGVQGVGLENSKIGIYETEEEEHGLLAVEVSATW